MASYYGLQKSVESLVVSNRKIDEQDSHSRTPLWQAARDGHVAVVRLLLEKGAAVDSTDRHGRTPLWSAKETGDEVLVELLKSASKRG
jgi:ankyrin repeat protein